MDPEENSKMYGKTLLREVRGNFLREAIGTGKRILDIGCRDGELTQYFMEGNEVTGADLDTAALALAKERGIQAIQLDLCNDWSVGTYDVVAASEVLEHLFRPDKVIQRVSLSLNKGGLFVGTIPNGLSLRNRVKLLFLQKENTDFGNMLHVNHFGVKEFRKLLQEHFSDVEVEGYGKFGVLSRLFPQTFAFILLFKARRS